MASPEALLTNAMAPSKRKDRSALISALSNLSIQYNFTAIAVALAIMDNSAGNKDPSYVPAYPRTTVQEGLLKSLVFAGAIVGQISMGYAGDVLGRRNAMCLTNFLAFLGSLGSAVFTWGDAHTVYSILMGCRFLIGVGVGGKYPLSATMRSEACDEARDEARTESHSQTQVALGFFWQTPGGMLPYAVALLVLQCFGRTDTSLTTVSIEFRIIFGLGAVPALLVMLLCYAQEDSAEYKEVRRNARSTVEPLSQHHPSSPGSFYAPSSPSSSTARVHASAAAPAHRRWIATSNNPFAIALRHPEHWWRLMGTGLSWLVYDFVYYGTTVNQPAILDSVFGHADSLWANCVQNIMVASFGLPGIVAAIAMLRCLGTKRLQAWGFVSLACSAALFALVILVVPSSTAASFGVFCLLITCLNWGANVSTYVLPTETFPTAVRSSFFGVSAAMGKVGALTGGALFGPIAASGAHGLPIVLLICTALSIVGIWVTVYLVEPSGANSFFGCSRGV